MAQELCRSSLPLPGSPAPSTSSETNSLFSPSSALNSAISTPRTTPCRDSLEPTNATAQDIQKLHVEPEQGVKAQDEKQLDHQWHQQQQAPIQQAETQVQPPNDEPPRFRPYPPEMYAQGYAPPTYAPHPAYATAPYAYPAGVVSYPPGMMMGPAAHFPPPPPGVYAPQQHMASYAPYQYAFPQPPYVAPVSQAMNGAVQYGFPSAQAGPAPMASVNPPVAVSAEQVQAAASPSAATISQAPVHDGQLTQAGMAAAQEGMVNSLPTADAAFFYNLGLMHSASGYAQPVENAMQQTQQYPPMPGYVSPEVYFAMGQQMGYSNAGFMQQTEPVASSPAKLKAGKRKRTTIEGGVAKTRRPRTSRPRAENDPDFKRVTDEKGNTMYECKLEQCKGMRMKEASVHHHRQSTCHSGSKHLLTCTSCGERISRSDGLKRHENSNKCARNQADNVKRGLTPRGSTPTPTPPATVPSDQLTYAAPGPGPNSIPQQAPPLPVFAGSFSYTPTAEPTAQAPRAELSSAPQQTSGASPSPCLPRNFRCRSLSRRRRRDLNRPRFLSKPPRLFLLSRLLSRSLRGNHLRHAQFPPRCQPLSHSHQCQLCRNFLPLTRLTFILFQNLTLRCWTCLSMTGTSRQN